MDVFLVTSPLQYICALEACHQYNSTQNILVLIEQKASIGIKHMEAIFDNSKWTHVIRCSRDNRSFNVPKLIKQIKRISGGKLERFFFSEYIAWRTKLFIRNLAFNEHIYFDDGTLTFDDYYDHILPRKEFYRPRPFNDFLVMLNGCKPIGKLPYFENTEIFSIYEFPDCSTRYRNNTMSLLRNEINKGSDGFRPFSIFIGQACIDQKGHIHSSEYIGLLEKYADLASETVLYLPHRTETEAVSKKISAISNLRFHHSSYPIEIELYMKKITPVELMGISSTALSTLSKLYPEAKVRLINQNEIQSTNRYARTQNYLSAFFSNLDAS
jgi:hypothetical protein